MIRPMGAGTGEHLSGIGGNPMNAVARLAGGFGALCLLIGLMASNSSALAQATPVPNAIESPILNADGATVGMLYVGESASSVTFTVLLSAGALAPGEHGIHVHEVGSCDPTGEPAFVLAGGHFNPTDSRHGAPGLEKSHAGDLGNMTVAEDGSAAFSLSTDRVTLALGEVNSLADADGSTLLIHAGVDDLSTDPSGESGDRLLCAVISAASTNTTVASPTA